MIFAQTGTEVYLSDDQWDALHTYLYDYAVYFEQAVFLLQVIAIALCVLCGWYLWRLFSLSKNQRRLLSILPLLLIPTTAHTADYDFSSVETVQITGVGELGSTFSVTATGYYDPPGPTGSSAFSLYYERDPSGGSSSNSSYDDIDYWGDSQTAEFMCQLATWLVSNEPTTNNGGSCEGSDCIEPLKCFSEAITSGNWTSVDSHYNYPADNDPHTSYSGCTCGGGGPVDTDGDGIPDEEDDDDDGDGIPDEEDPCPLEAANECEAATLDTDGDGIPDYLDDDDDGDGIPDDEDPCPLNPELSCEEGCNGQPADNVEELKIEWADCDYDGDGCRNADDPAPYDPEIDCDNKPAPDLDEDDCKEKINDRLDQIVEALEDWGINFSSLTNLDGDTYPGFQFTIPSWKAGENIVDSFISFDPAAYGEPWQTMLQTARTLIRTGLIVLTTVWVWYKILDVFRTY